MAINSFRSQAICSWEATSTSLPDEYFDFPRDVELPHGRPLLPQDKIMLCRNSFVAAFDDEDR